jgi:predicted TIM-barrel fold metal-dependent hydrolase
MSLLTRRDFHKRALAAAAAGLALPMARAEDAAPAGKYVDFHTHLGQPWGQRPELTVDDLLRWMDNHAILKAVVLPLVSPESYDYVITPDYVLDKTKPHRDRLIPFCSIDPRTVNLGSYEAKRDLLLRYVEAGAKGFGEHKTGIAIDDPRNIEVFRACTETKLPILFHMDNQRNMDSPGLPGLESVLKQFPDGIFIGHANGWWASIDGDCTQEEMQQYPDDPVTPGGAIDRLMDAYPNLYGDLSAGSGANAIMRDMAFGREFVIRRADRLLWATDFLAPGQNVPQLNLYDTLELPEEVQAKVFRENARRLLNL